MNGQHCTLTLLSIAVNCCVGVQIASSQNLTDEWVEKAAGPLVEYRVVDGLSVGYIEGEHFGIVHLGSSSLAGKKADYLTVYEIGSVSKVFTGLMLADAPFRPCQTGLPRWKSSCRCTFSKCRTWWAVSWELYC